MLTLTLEQFALLSLPDPHMFAPRLAAEIRRDYPHVVAGESEPALTQATARSYRHASEALRLTRLPTLVAWVKADVAWARGLRHEMTVDLQLRRSATPNLAAQDVLSALAAGAGWPREGG